MKKSSLLTLVFISSLLVSCSDNTELSQKEKAAIADMPPISAVKVGSPSFGAYTGAYVDFGDYEDTVTLEAIQAFDKMVGKKQALIGSSSYWGRKTFPRKNLDIISAYGAIPFIYWNPWDRDEWDEKHVNRFDLYSIIAGKHDKYIEMWGDEAKAYGKPILVAWGLEMNGNWFPWSGVFHGADKPIPGTNPVLFEGPEAFKKAYKHVIDKVRSRGANNIEWVFHANNTCDPYDPSWNNMAAYYPGSDYADWLALSTYGQQYPHAGWIRFEQALHPFYEELTKLDPNKPVLMAEWGVGHFPKSGSQAQWVGEALKRFVDTKEFPNLKGAIFWHERWQNGDGTYSNLRVNADDNTVKSYRKAIADKKWLDRPQFVTR